MDFENFNQRIGGCGRYQYICFLLLSLTTFKYCGDIQAISFALFVPKFQCVVESDELTDHQNTSHLFSNDQCRYKESLNGSWKPCSKWIYDRDVLLDSFISEFDLVCDREHYRELMFSVYFFGSLSSYPLIMSTDKLGRRLIFLIFIFLSIFISISQTVFHYLWLHFVLSYFVGFIRSVFINLAIVTLFEMIPANKVDIASTNFWDPYSISYMATALFTFYGRTWRWITWCGLVLTVFYFLFFCFVPETPRWLMLNQKRERSYKTMLFIAKINGHAFSRKEFDEWKPIHQPTGKFWNLLKYKVMIYRLLILNFAAWSFSFAYIGSSTDLTFASNNIFITTFMMGLTELPSLPLAGFLANRLGRKPSLSLLCSLGIVCLIPLPFFEADISKSSWQPWLKVIAAMGAKLGFVGAWGILDIILNETTPTTDRCSAMSLVYITVGLGSIVAPMIHNLATHFYYAAPCLMYSGILVITVILVNFFIPETHTLPVPQTIEQAVSLIIHKENEWKENMTMQAHNLGMDKNTGGSIELKV